MCLICASALLADLNKKVNWRPDRIIKWAGRRGLVIDEKQLHQHFECHLGQPHRNNKNKAGQPLADASAQKAEKSVKDKLTSLPTSAEIKSSVSDEIFLNKVIGDVFQSLVAGHFDLKLEHGFKAIELKQKIVENTNVENRLLELLNEIRSQELAAAGEIISRN